MHEACMYDGEHVLQNEVQVSVCVCVCVYVCMKHVCMTVHIYYKVGSGFLYVCDYVCMCVCMCVYEACMSVHMYAK